MKKTLSSIDLYALTKEFQQLQRAKLQQIYHPVKEEFCLHFHIPGSGKQYLRIIAGKMINFTADKRSTLNPTGLCMLLRKYLTGAIIENVHQKDSERVIIFDFLRGEDKFHLIVELFSKGNVVLTDDSWTILALQSWQLRESRKVKTKEVYKFPPSRLNWITVEAKEFEKIIQSSEKKNLATTIATEIGIGGVFAEELCARAEIDSKKETKDLSEKDITVLYTKFQEILKELNTPKGFVYEKEISPIKLNIEKVGELKEEKETLSEAFDLINPLVKISPYEKKIEQTQKIIEKQEESVKQIEQDIIDNTKKGELIYEKYADIAKLQTITKQIAEKDGWEVAKEQLEAQSKIIKVDLKKKTVILDL